MTITIYHNPACGTSRNTLAMIRASGEEPVVIEYLKTPPGRERLLELIAAMGITPRELLREKGTPYAELGLADPKWSDDELVDFMLAHPSSSTGRSSRRRRAQASAGLQKRCCRCSTIRCPNSSKKTVRRSTIHSPSSGRGALAQIVIVFPVA